ncbi:MAG: nucleotide sugar dehydrogenase [Alphaproteobacteria bacterium]
MGGAGGGTGAKAGAAQSDPAPSQVRRPGRIAVIGLGYVGLPLALAFSRRFELVGFDSDPARIVELREGRDRTREVEHATLASTRCRFTDRPQDMAGSDLFVITVPTPVDRRNKPDLSAVLKASETVGRAIAPGAIVVLESTVAPGTTEELVGPTVARESGLVPGRDFFLGYSPERINPGDREHAIDRIAKVVAGESQAVAEVLREAYGAITAGGVFVAKDIRTAEAAKVIENAQRDLNIAFINEVAMIFGRAGLSIHDVLEASATKWNFLRFSPGLVGGHCIGVDPFYLADYAERLGLDPAIVLAGRRINDAMGAHIAGRIAAALAGTGGPAAPARVLVLGLTFKENVPDIRNTKVVDLVRALESGRHSVDVHDPIADPKEALALHGIALKGTLEGLEGYGCLVGAVAHDLYRRFTARSFATLVAPGGLVADVKGMWRGVELPAGLGRWEL